MATVTIQIKDGESPGDIVVTMQSEPGWPTDSREMTDAQIAGLRIMQFASTELGEGPTKADSAAEPQKSEVPNGD